MTSKMLSASASHPTQVSGPFPFLGHMRRPVALALVLVVATFATGGLTAARTVGLAALARFYSVFDPWSKSMAVEFGPRVSTDKSVASSAEMEVLLNEWFPDHEYSVRRLPEDLPVPGDHFAHENLSHPNIANLNEIAALIAPSTTPLLQACDRFRQLTRHGDSDVHAVSDNPIELLRLARQGTPMTCRPFAVSFMGYCISRGYTARILGLSKDGLEARHAVVEVFAPEHGKWLVIDPDFNLVYRRGGRLLDAWELHDVWQQVRKTMCKPTDPPAEVVRKVTARRGEIAGMTGVELVCLGESACRDLWETSLKYDSFTQTNLEYFEVVLYNTRNDYLSASYPVGHPRRVRQFALSDEESSRAPAVCPEATRVSARDDVYWNVGSSTARISGPSQAKSSTTVLVELGTWTPNFSAFEVRRDSANWDITSGPTCEWTLHAGSNMLEARSVNLGGLRGQIARIEIICKPRDLVSQEE